ncbi:MAG: tetratricopeptide repeat protein [Nitrospira sp.]|nr:tetratricopeptide repeat protein [Nitrospira sp.]
MSSEQLAEAARLYDKKRYEDALAQYALLAEQGDEYAARWAGWIIYKGLCARNNPQEAIHYYLLAAQSGSTVAWFDLAAMYARVGEYQKAIEWYERSAAEGYLPALYRLGRCYQSGKGVNQNEEKALAYFEKAASQGHIFAKGQLMRRRLVRDYGRILGSVFLQVLVLQAVEADYKDCHGRGLSSNR